MKSRSFTPDEDEELEEELKSSDVDVDNKLDKDVESSSDIGKA